MWCTNAQVNWKWSVPRKWRCFDYRLCKAYGSRVKCQCLHGICFDKLPIEVAIVTETNRQHFFLELCFLLINRHIVSFSHWMWLNAKYILLISLDLIDSSEKLKNAPEWKKKSRQKNLEVPLEFISIDDKNNFFFAHSHASTLHCFHSIWWINAMIDPITFD